MKRFIVPVLCVLLMQGTSLWAKGGKEAAKDDYVIKVGLGIDVRPGGEVDWVVFSTPDLPLALEQKQVDALPLTTPRPGLWSRAARAG